MAVNPGFLSQPVTLDGQTKTVAEWCELRGLNLNTVYSRRLRCCNWQEALSTNLRGAQLRKRLDLEFLNRGAN